MEDTISVLAFFLLSRAGKECLDMGQFIRLRVANELYVLKKDRWGFAYDRDRITDMCFPVKVAGKSKRGMTQEAFIEFIS